MSNPLYFDHNMQDAVAAALRSRGIDVLTAWEDHYDHEPDDIVLQRAQALGRVLVTHDQDYLKLAHDWQSAAQPFAGIVFCHLSQSPIGLLISELELVAQTMTADELANTVVWIPL